MAITKIKDKVYWVGAVDWDIRDFHGYSTYKGTTYNAYLVMDEKNKEYIKKLVTSSDINVTDLVAKKGNLVAFVEVKARATAAELDFAIDERRLARVALRAPNPAAGLCRYGGRRAGGKRAL